MGKELAIKRNAVRCRKCDEIIESVVDRHDFRLCECGATAVDGGHEYLRRIGSDWEELSEMEAYDTIEE